MMGALLIWVPRDWNPMKRAARLLGKENQARGIDAVISTSPALALAPPPPLVLFVCGCVGIRVWRNPVYD